jgi:hypothetical protein
MDIFTIVRTLDHVKPRTFPSLEMQVRHTFFSLVHLALGAPNVPRPLVTSPAKLIISYMLVQARIFLCPEGFEKGHFSSAALRTNGTRAIVFNTLLKNVFQVKIVRYKLLREKI